MFRDNKTIKNLEKIIEKEITMKSREKNKW